LQGGSWIREWVSLNISLLLILDILKNLSIRLFLERNSRNIQNPTEILSDDSTEPLDDSEAGIVNTPNDDSNDISDSLNEDSLLVNDTRELIPQSSTNQETPEAELNENSPNNDSEVHGTCAT
jgi:hypothetical protein